jgi:L-Ala-D/L-Glu epimerase
MLRTATVADLPGLAEVFVASWRTGYRGTVPDEVIDGLRIADVAAELGADLDARDRSTVVAVDGSGTALGFVRFGSARRTDEPELGYLASLYVHPAAGGRGLGRTLLRHALRELAGRPVKLWVFAGNGRARELYERAGFRLDGAELTDPRWRAPQLRYRRAAVNEARPLRPLPDVELPAITAVSVRPLVRPLRRPFRTALREVRELAAHEVIVHTASGAVGRGTTVATPQITGDTDASIRAAVCGPVSESVRGAVSLADAVVAIEAAGPGDPSARAAVDLAVHDLAAGCLGVELPALLGDEPLPLRSDLSISVAAPEEMADAARAAVAEGARTVKLKLADAELDVQRVRAVVRALDTLGEPVRIRLDVNQAWSRDQAVRVLDAIADVAVELVEQPVAAADLDGLAFVRARTRFPILADESVFTAADVHRVAAAGAADLVNLKLLKCGGLGPARAVVAACADTGLGLLVGCMLEPAEGVAAARALAAVASCGSLAHDLDAGWWAGEPL